MVQPRTCRLGGEDGIHIPLLIGDELADLMETFKKLLPTFDKFLLAGLGCGLFGLCILFGAFVYIWQNPPRPRSIATQTPGGFAGLPTVPGSDFPTPTSSSAIIPTLEGVLSPTLIPSSAPGLGVGFALPGKIVFTCFINKIDQICIMNADGTGRKQLTDFEATAFYASLAPDGQTVYFSSRQSGTFEIYAMDINGNGLQRLTNSIGTLYAPELSPDGQRIVFTNHGNGLWVMDANGENPRAISFRNDIDPT